MVTQRVAALTPMASISVYIRKVAGTRRRRCKGRPTSWTYAGGRAGAAGAGRRGAMVQLVPRRIARVRRVPGCWRLAGCARSGSDAKPCRGSVSRVRLHAPDPEAVRIFEAMLTEVGCEHSTAVSLVNLALSQVHLSIRRYLESTTDSGRPLGLSD